MTSVTQVENHLRTVLTQRARELARSTGCVQRERKFDGASLVQMLIFGFLAEPHPSLEQLASTAATMQVQVSDTAVMKRFNEPCARLLQALLAELCQLEVQAEEAVPLPLLRRFSQVILEDRSSVLLPAGLREQFPGLGGRRNSRAGAMVNLHTRWDLLTGRLWGPALTDGWTSDRSSPLHPIEVEPAGLYVADLGYFDVKRIAARRKAGAYTLTRYKSRTVLLNRKGKRLSLPAILPRKVGEAKEVPVLLSQSWRHPMRLLLLRVPQAVAQARRARLHQEAALHQRPIPQESWELADWTILLTDAPKKLLPLSAALILGRERWQIEILYRVWKDEGQIDEWWSHQDWRAICELLAKLIGMLIGQWCITLFAWHNPHRSLLKLGQVVRQAAPLLCCALAGLGKLCDALLYIQRRMQAGCCMNKQRKKPSSAQLLEEGLSWPFVLLA